MNKIDKICAYLVMGVIVLMVMFLILGGPIFIYEAIRMGHWWIIPFYIVVFVGWRGWKYIETEITKGPDR